VLVRRENARAKVVEATPVELRWLNSYLQFEDQKKVFMRRKYGRGETTTRLLDMRGNTFPSGLVDLVQTAADAYAFEFAQEHFDIDRLGSAVETEVSSRATTRKALDEYAESFRVRVDDRRIRPCEFDFDADLEWLDNHQFDAVWAAQEAGNGIVKLATASGKTEIMCGLFKSLPCHWLLVVHRKGLMWQAGQRWAARAAGCYARDLAKVPASVKAGFPEFGVIGDGQFRPDPNGRVTVATFQSLALGLNGRAATKKNPAIPPDPRVRRLLQDVDGLAVDECHTCAADTFWGVCMAAKNAYFRLGFSGTPLARGDRRSVLAVGALGGVVYEVPTQQLIDEGVLAKPRIVMVPHEESGDYEDWQKAYDGIVVGSGSRNALVIDLVRNAEKPCFVFVVREAHGKFLTDMIRQDGIPAEFVWGKKHTKQRDAAVERLRTGRTEALVCSVVFQEGVDVPDLRSVIIAGGMKSTIAALQRIGRGMRTDKSSGKTTFTVWDIMDKGNGFIAGHAKNRRRAYKSDGHEVEVVTPPGLRGTRRRAG
jgi:superfamily II DNA or RNA helicase